MRATVIGFLCVSDLYPRKSCGSHECLLMTYRPSTGHSLFSFLDTFRERELGDTCLGYGTIGCRKKEGDRIAAQGWGLLCVIPTLKVCDCPQPDVKRCSQIFT